MSDLDKHTKVEPISDHVSESRGCAAFWNTQKREEEAPYM